MADGVVEVADSSVTILDSLLRGMEDRADVIFIVFIVGGVIGIIKATGAIDALIGTAIRVMGSRAVFLVGGMVFLFAVGSSTIGMAEEYLAFIPILVAMCIALKMDAIVAMGIVYIGAGVGYGCAAYNPFTVVIAQNIADVSPLSGGGYRWILLVVCTIVGVHHIMRYARKIRSDPSKSLVGDVDYSKGFEIPEDTKMTKARVFVLGFFAVAMGVFIWGASEFEWYFHELSVVFIASGIVAAICGKLTPNRAAREFCSGAAVMTSTALLIGFAGAIKIVMDQGQISDTIIHAVASPLQKTGPEVASIGMLAVQSMFNFFVPSGSGQALVTMPIMAPVAELTGVPAQTAILAYQFGDGFTNMIVPTNALLMGMLQLGKIPYQRWLRFILPLMVKLYVIAIVALILAVWMNY
jgi:uncharacterized ion transporter superfamily protein YfcC